MKDEHDITLLSTQPDHIGEVTEMVGDAVSRQGVLRLLNAVPSEEFATKAMLISGVNALPSTQPEIIHCKDCKYNPNPPECGNAACVLFYGMTDQMGFCHHGERRERE